MRDGGRCPPVVLLALGRPIAGGAGGAGRLPPAPCLGVRVARDRAPLGAPRVHDGYAKGGEIGIVRFELDDGVFPYGDFVVKE